MENNYYRDLSQILISHMPEILEIQEVELKLEDNYSYTNDQGISYNLRRTEIKHDLNRMTLENSLELLVETLRDSHSKNPFLYRTDTLLLSKVEKEGEPSNIYTYLVCFATENDKII